MRLKHFSRVSVIGSSLALLFLIIATISIVGLNRISRNYMFLSETQLVMQELAHTMVDLISFRNMLELDEEAHLDLTQCAIYQDELEQHFTTLNRFFAEHILEEQSEFLEYLHPHQEGEIEIDPSIEFEKFTLPWTDSSQMMIRRINSLLETMNALQQSEHAHLQIMTTRVEAGLRRALTITVICIILSLITFCAIIILLIRELIFHRNTSTVLQRTSRTLQVSSRINALLIRTDNSNELFDNACRMLVEVGGYRFAWIGVAMNDPERRVRPIAHDGLDAGYLDRLIISWGDNKYGRGPTGVAIRTGRPAISHAIENDTRFSPWRTEALKRDFRSSAALPIFSHDGSCLGSLNVYSRELGAFSREEIELLTELTNSLHIGLQVIQERQDKRDLQVELARKAKTLSERVKELDCLYRIGELIQEQDSSLEELLQDILRQIPPAFLDPDRTSARLNLDHDGEELTLITDRFRTSRWCLASPLTVDGESIGVLEVFRATEGKRIERDPFFPEERALLNSIAIKIQRNIKFLKAAAMKERAEKELALQRAQMMTADRLRSLGEMSTAIAHELSQPLQGVRGLSEHLLLQQKNSRQITDGDYTRILESIIEQSDRMVFLIKHVRDFARGAADMEGAPVNINEVIQSSLFLFRTQLSSNDVALHCDLAEEISLTLANHFALEEVIINLLSNALFALKGSEDPQPAIIIRTYISTREDGEYVNMDVVDNGPGIPRESLTSVFEPFFTTKNQGEGTGLGLPISREIIKQYQGSLTIRNMESGGAIASVTLPVFRESRTMEASG